VVREVGVTRVAPSSRVEIGAFLATDQARISGVALAGYRDSRMHGVQSGTAAKPEHRVRMIQAARQRAGCLCYVGGVLPAYPCPCRCQAITRLAVVMEDHSTIPASSGVGTPTLLGMGAARGRWEEDLEHMGHPESMRFAVDMPTWRGTILGPRWARARKCHGACKPGCGCVKAEAVKWASARTRRDDVEHDEAEALCILHWAADAIPAKLARERLQRDLFAGVG
jgi:hypothetical protein